MILKIWISLDLSGHNSLSKLHLGLATQSDLKASMVLHYLTQTLATIGRAQLTSLKINMTLVVARMHLVLDEYPPFFGVDVERNLKYLDELIARQENLQTVSVAITMSYFADAENEAPPVDDVHPTEGFPNAQDYIRRQLPRLVKRGGLKLTAVMYVFSEDGEDDVLSDGSWES